MPLLSRIFGCFRHQEAREISGNPSAKSNNSDLPLSDDNLVQIFKFLNINDLANVSRVSRRFNDIAIKVYSHRSIGQTSQQFDKIQGLFISVVHTHNQKCHLQFAPFATTQQINFSNIASNDELQERIGYAPLAQKVIFEGDTKISPKDINLSLKNLPYLRQVTFVNNTDGQAMALAIKGLTHLQSFVCQSTEKVNVTPLLKTLSQDSTELEQLILDGNTEIESVINEKYPLADLSENCTQLKKLHLSKKTNISINVQNFIKEVITKNLEELSFTHMDFDNVHMQMLTLKCKGMKSLNVGFNKQLEPKIIDNIFKQMTTIVSLELQGFTTETAGRFNQYVQDSTQKPTTLSKIVFH